MCAYLFLYIPLDLTNKNKNYRGIYMLDDFYLDESIDPDLDWACRQTLLEMNTDPELIDHICHTLTYESVVRLCLNDGEPLTEASLLKKRQRKKGLTVAEVGTMTSLVFKRWQHINKEGAALKAAKKAQELEGRARKQGRKKAQEAARKAKLKWRSRAKQYAKEARGKRKRKK
jgi:hypothetical protein